MLTVAFLAALGVGEALTQAEHSRRGGHQRDENRGDELFFEEGHAKEVSCPQEADELDS